MADIRNKTASIYIDDTAAQAALTNLQQKADGLNKSIDETRKRQKALTDEIARAKAAGENYSKQSKELSKLNTELGKGSKALVDNTAKQKALQQQIDTKTGPSLKQQQALVNKLVNEFKNLGSNSEAAASKLKEIEGASKTLVTLKDRLAAVQNVQKESSHGLGLGEVFTKVLEFSGAYAIVQKGFDLVHNFMEGTIEEADQAQEAVDGLTVALTNAGRMDLLKPLLDEADRFAAKYRALDNDDITAVFTKLVDYGKLTKGQISEVTEVIINYARKQKVSVEEATDVITKALEGQARGLKTYGISISDAKTFTERYNLVVDELGKKVQGAEAAFEETGKGIRAKFGQAIRDAQESIGKLIYSITELPKSAGELFDEAKQESDNLQNSLTPLIARYDELKSKTKLNKDEQTELHGIIQKIVEIVPDAATEFNKYGVALDINKNKVTNFINENKKFLAEKEFKAVEEATSRAFENLKQIDLLRRQIQRGVTTTTISGGGGLGVGSTTTETKSTEEEQKQRLSQLRGEQDKLLNNAGLLVDKYGKELPSAIKKAVDAISAEAKAIRAVETKEPQKIIGTGTETPEEKEARLAREKQAKEDADKRAKEAEAERKRILEDQKKLDEELLKLQHEYEGKVESEYMKELQAAFDKYDKLKELAYGKKEELKKIEVGFNQAIAKINAEYAQKAIDDLKKLDDEKRKLREKQLQDQLKKGFEFLNAVAADVAKDADRKNQLRKAQDDYDIAHASGKKLFELELKQLDDEEALAVAAARKRGDSVEAVELEFQKKREELQAGRFEKEVELYLGFAQQALSILNTFDEGRRNKEAAELGRIQKTHDAEKASYQRMLNSKAISKQQFDKKVAELDAQADKKRQEIEKRQFERNKKIQLAQALVNGALGITSVLAARPGAVDVISLGAFRAINIALTVAATAAQVAAIARSKYEGGAKYAKGGALTGPSHKDGGMPVINPRTGRKEAEVEGGEVILSRKTVSNNKGLVDALLYSSMHKEGARIDPWFKNRTYKAIDFSGISRSIQNVRHYASGGVFTSNASDTPQAPTPSVVILPPGFEALPDLLQAVANRLAVTPKAYVVYQDIKDADDTIASIKGAATFGKK
jgi:hypothetical protein